MSENEYGNTRIPVGVSSDIGGVSLWTMHPETGEHIRLLRLGPEFAREIAQQMTLNSFECEDLRQKLFGKES